MIFKDFNDLLKRNPGAKEFADWYFYMNYALNGWDCNTPEYFEKILLRDLKRGKEYKCLQKAGAKKDVDCPGAPADIMSADPFATTAATTTSDTTTTDTTSNANVVDDFMNGITDSAASDPLWTGDGYQNVADTESPTASEMAAAKIKLTRGYNAFFVPSNMTAVDATGLTNSEYVTFAFNQNGSKQWYSSERSTPITAFTKGIGYYVYARTGGEEVALKDVSNATAGVQISRGWNLLANEGADAGGLADFKFNVAKTASCTSLDCTESKTLKELYQAGRAYENIFVVADEQATEAAKAFQTVKVTTDTLDSVTIPAKKIFWFYMWE
jgi:hypothetical protein